MLPEHARVHYQHEARRAAAVAASLARDARSWRAFLLEIESCGAQYRHVTVEKAGAAARDMRRTCDRIAAVLADCRDLRQQF